MSYIFSRHVTKIPLRKKKPLELLRVAVIEGTLCLSITTSVLRAGRKKQCRNRKGIWAKREAGPFQSREQHPIEIYVLNSTALSLKIER